MMSKMYCPWPIFLMNVLLNIGLLRTVILRLECVVLKQTQMYICTLEEFIPVNVVTLLYKYELI